MLCRWQCGNKGDRGSEKLNGSVGSFKQDLFGYIIRGVSLFTNDLMLSTDSFQSLLKENTGQFLVNFYGKADTHWSVFIKKALCHFNFHKNFKFVLHKNTSLHFKLQEKF